MLEVSKRWRTWDWKWRRKTNGVNGKRIWKGGFWAVIWRWMDLGSDGCVWGGGSYGESSPQVRCLVLSEGEGRLASEEGSVVGKHIRKKGFGYGGLCGWGGGAGIWFGAGQGAIMDIKIKFFLFWTNLNSQESADTRTDLILSLEKRPGRTTALETDCWWRDTQHQGSWTTIRESSWWSGWMGSSSTHIRHQSIKSSSLWSGLQRTNRI